MTFRAEFGCHHDCCYCCSSGKVGSTCHIWYKGGFCGLRWSSECIAGLPCSLGRHPLKATALVISWHGCLHWAYWTCPILNYWYCWNYWNCRKCLLQIWRWMVGNHVSYRCHSEHPLFPFGVGIPQASCLPVWTPRPPRSRRVSQVYQTCVCHWRSKVWLSS